MTPERRKELEERARAWQFTPRERCEPEDQCKHGFIWRHNCCECLVSLLEAVDREAEERGRREREVLAIEDAVAWSAERLALVEENRRLREAGQEMCSWVSDVLQGWQAHAQIAAGKGGGMGANILQESAARYGSRYHWGRVERALDGMRAALAGKASE